MMWPRYRKAAVAADPLLPQPATASPGFAASPLQALLHVRKRYMLGLAVALVVLALLYWQADWVALELPTRMVSMSAAAYFYDLNPVRSDIIVSLTTVPGRENLVSLTIKTLLLQTASPKEIHVHVPLNTRFGAAPDLSFLDRVAAIRIFTHEVDLGPAMKAIPTIVSSSADQGIVYLDDDTLYPRDLIATFQRWSVELPDAALTARGWAVPVSRRWIDAPAVFGTSLTAPLPTDIVTGCGGVFVRPRFFDATALVAFSSAPKEAFFVDDIWLSGNLARQGVPRFIIPTTRKPTTQVLAMATLSLSGAENADGRNNDVVLAHFNAYWLVSADRSAPKAKVDV